ncbi:DUF2750 domain-containing protein [Gilliamella sp. Pas-s27]|uniref:DUF2750 domain-containing protein n=1 Tax=Gilliamella sp. Pas-s27 TaxID=2687311 RepID=UPI0013653644|nr:DUF2750 domain-containing protein [Gilliamella sp. Pas-s27]MWP47742.1 DUF2750 domain-containing protein [Gilliamella sp. Pas-s27]
MNKEKILNVTSLDSKERLDYFIRKVADFEVLWGNYGDNGWLQLYAENGKKIMPFWPEKEFVINYNVTHKFKCSPKEINLDYFLDKWIKGLAKEKISLLIFPVEEKKSCIINPLELKTLLEEELKQYE